MCRSLRRQKVVGGGLTVCVLCCVLCVYKGSFLDGLKSYLLGRKVEMAAIELPMAMRLGMSAARAGVAL